MSKQRQKQPTLKAIKASNDAGYNEGYELAKSITTTRIKEICEQSFDRWIGDYAAGYAEGRRHAIEEQHQSILKLIHDANPV